MKAGRRRTIFLAMNAIMCRWDCFSGGGARSILVIAAITRVLSRACRHVALGPVERPILSGTAGLHYMQGAMQGPPVIGSTPTRADRVLGQSQVHHSPWCVRTVMSVHAHV